MKFFVSVSGGKDSTALLLWAKNNLPNDSIVPFFSDTGNEHEMTYQYIDYLQEKIGVEIIKLSGKFKSTKAEKYGLTEEQFKELPLMLQQALHKGRFASSQARFCTTDLKLEPAKRFINTFDDEKVMLVGVRRDESPARANAKKWSTTSFTNARSGAHWLIGQQMMFLTTSAETGLNPIHYTKWDSSE